MLFAARQRGKYKGSEQVDATLQGSLIRKDKLMNQAKSADRCPSCGAALLRLSFVCAYCGFAIPRTRPDRDAGTSPGSKNLARGNRPEFQEPDTPEELVAFFSEHIGGVSNPSWKQERHKRACEAALTKLKVFSAHDARLAQVTLGLQDQFHKACTTHKKSSFKVAIIGIAGLVIFGAFAAYMAIHQASGRAQARDDVQRLIGEGKFDEARIRAQDLRSKASIQETMELIDRAEKNAQKPGQ